MKKSLAVALIAAPAALAAIVVGGTLAHANTQKAPVSGTGTAHVNSVVQPAVVRPAAPKAAVVRPAAPAAVSDETQAPGTDPAGPDITTPDEPGTAEAGSTENDGPGGHADPAGQNVDHQFNGNE